MQLSDDDFSLFGLPQRFAIERAQLDERWRALQAEVHPDRFSAQGAASQRVAMQWAVRVNEAYRRLKDPVSRAAYLIQLRGVDVGAENNTGMPADFLMRQMTWREALEESSEPSAIQALGEEVDGDQAARLAALEVFLDQAVDLEAAALQVRALMFVDKFRADVDRRLEALGA